MATFLCWDPDEEDESGAESDARNHVRARDAESAARAYAETCNWLGDFAAERIVRVRGEDGALTRWLVEAAVTHSYTAKEVL